MRNKVSRLPGLISRVTFAAVSLFLAQPGAALAGPLEDGTAALEAGDYQTALTLLRPLARQGNVDAQFYIGGMYEHGWGVAADRALAMQWYIRAAKQGNGVAGSLLGALYEKGRVATRDHGEAVAWFRQVAGQLNPETQHQISLMYLNGWNVSLDETHAAEWFALAAEQGFEAAQVELRLLGKK